LKPPLVLSSCDSFFSLHEYFLTNPNGESVSYWISNNISKFHENLTVNETGIVGKEKAMVRGVFLLAPTCVFNSQRWECSELGYKRGDQISRWSNGEWVQDHSFYETGLGKRKNFEKRREKTRMRKRGGTVGVKTDLTLFIIMFTLFIYLFIIL